MSELITRPKTFQIDQGEAMPAVMGLLYDWNRQKTVRIVGTLTAKIGSNASLNEVKAMCSACLGYAYTANDDRMYDFRTYARGVIAFLQEKSGNKFEFRRHDPPIGCADAFPLPQDALTCLDKLGTCLYGLNNTPKEDNESWYRLALAHKEAFNGAYRQYGDERLSEVFPRSVVQAPAIEPQGQQVRASEPAEQRARAAEPSGQRSEAPARSEVQMLEVRRAMPSAAPPQQSQFFPQGQPGWGNHNVPPQPQFPYGGGMMQGYPQYPYAGMPSYPSAPPFIFNFGPMPSNHDHQPRDTSSRKRERSPSPPKRFEVIEETKKKKEEEKEEELSDYEKRKRHFDEVDRKARESRLRKFGNLGGSRPPQNNLQRQSQPYSVSGKDLGRYDPQPPPPSPPPRSSSPPEEMRFPNISPELMRRFRAGPPAYLSQTRREPIIFPNSLFNSGEGPCGSPGVSPRPAAVLSSPAGAAPQSSRTVDPVFRTITPDPEPLVYAEQRYTMDNMQEQQERTDEREIQGAEANAEEPMCIVDTVLYVVFYCMWWIYKSYAWLFHVNYLNIWVIYYGLLVPLWISLVSTTPTVDKIRNNHKYGQAKLKHTEASKWQW